MKSLKQWISKLLVLAIVVTAFSGIVSPGIVEATNRGDYSAWGEVSETHIILDNDAGAANGVTRGGNWGNTANKGTAGYYGENYMNVVQASSAWARYAPTITVAGYYDVYLTWVHNGQAATNVPVDVEYNGGSNGGIITERISISQRAAGPQTWADNRLNRMIGTFYFAEGSTGSVTISSLGGNSAGGHTFADAVRFKLNEELSVTHLSNLTVNDGVTLVPAIDLEPSSFINGVLPFNPAITDYIANVANSVETVNITPVTVSESVYTAMTVNGTPVSASDGVYITPLDAGIVNEIIIVAAADDMPSTTYTIAITRAGEPNNDATLNNLITSAGTLTPLFNPGIEDYALNVGNTVETIDITAIANSADHIGLTLNGNDINSGSANPIILNVGDNLITIIVTAENGDTKTYTLNVNRAESVSTDATLKNLYINNGYLSFHPDTFNYNVNLSSVVNSLIIRPVPNSGDFDSITINGDLVPSSGSYTVPLVTGENEISIIVTAEDGETTETYTLQVFKAEARGEVVGNAGIIHPAIAEKINNAVVLYVGHNEAYTSNVRTTIDLNNSDVRPFTQESVTYVPVRYVAEGFNIAVQSGESGSLTVNGTTFTDGDNAVLKEGHLFAPVSDVATALNKEVFLGGEGLLIIFSDSANLFDLPAEAALVQEIVDGFLYEWGNVKIYPGGFVTGMVIHPLEPELMYARTDIGGAYRWNPDSELWIPLTENFSISELSLVGIDGIAISRTDSDVVYMAAGMYGYQTEVPHDVLKSTDRGQTWQRTGLDKRFFGNSAGGTYGDQRIDGERIAVDPFNGDIVYVGTRYDGLWYTIDGAANWAQVAEIPVGSNHVGITNVEFDYSAGVVGEGDEIRAKVIYVGVEGAGVYKTVDGGATWTATLTDLDEGPVYPRRMALSSEGDLYVTSITGIFRQELTVDATTAPTNGVFKYDGNTWTNVTPLASIGQPFGPIAVKPDNPNFVAAAEGYYRGANLYVSENGGTTWSLKGNSYGASGQILFDPHNTDVLYNLHGSGIHKTENFSISNINWIVAGDGIEELAATNMLSLPDGTLIMGTLDRGGFTSIDKTIPAVRLDPPTRENTSIDFSEGDPNYVFRLASSSGAGGGIPRAFYSTDGAVSWTEVQPFPYGIGGAVAVSATKQQDNGPPLVVIWTNTHTPKLSRDFGQTWEDTVFVGTDAPVYTGHQFDSRRYGLDADRVLGDFFYLYDTVAGKFYTSSDGKTWSLEAAAMLPAGIRNDIAGVRAAPGVAGEVWASNNKQGLFRSTDFGKTFTKLDNVEEALMFSFGANKPGNSHPTVYVYGRINNVNGVFRSDDLGASWTRLNNDAYQLANDAKSIVGDRNTYGTVYVGTGGRGIYYGQILGTDSEAPRLTLDQASSTSVEDADYAVRDSIFLISGTINEPGLVNVNGTILNISQAGTFSTTVNLIEGLNTITITATDQFGNQTRPVDIIIRHDPAYVGITLDDLRHSTNQTEYVISGRVNTAATVRVNDDVAPVDEDFNFQLIVPLAEGDNSFLITAVNDSNQAAAPVELTVTLDQVTPVLSIEQTHYETDQRYVLLEGAVSKESQVLIFGNDPIVGSDLNFQAVLYLQPGSNQFTVEAVDAAGNIAEPVLITANYTVPAVPGIPLTKAHYVERNSITLDGELDEEYWDINELLGKPGIGSPNNVVHFGTLWDDDYLYVGVIVKDKVLVRHPTTIFQGDSVEVYVSPTNSRQASHLASDKQLQFGWNWDEVRAGGSKSTAGIEFVQKDIENGYVMEIKIPWSNLGSAEELAVEGKVIGFEVNNIDNDGIYENGNRDSVLLWNGTMDNWTNTTMFGELQLAGVRPVLSSDATLSALEVSEGELEFAADTFSYELSVANSVSSISVTATAASEAHKSITVNDDPQDSDTAATVPLAVGANTITIVVTAENDATLTYTITVTRASAPPQYVVPPQEDEEEVEEPTEPDPETGTDLATVILPDDLLTAVGADDVTVIVTAVDSAEIGLSSSAQAAIGDRPIISVQLQTGTELITWMSPEAFIRVSIPYTPTTEELENPEHIVIWSIDAEGNVSPVTSGRYDAATETVNFTINRLNAAAYAISYVVKTFEDTAAYSWAEHQIQVLASKGIINGTTETTFTPAANITRADFLVLLVKTLGLWAEADSNFVDVDPGTYYAEAVGIARQLGIANGVDGNRFDPGAPITRQDLFTLTARALAVAEKLQTVGTEADLQQFADVAEIADYAAESIASLVREGIVQGDGELVRPFDNTTRAEAAVMLYRIYNK